jgi:hypothetical protein
MSSYLLQVPSPKTHVKHTETIKKNLILFFRLKIQFLGVLCDLCERFIAESSFPKHRFGDEFSRPYATKYSAVCCGVFYSLFILNPTIKTIKLL